MRPAYVEHKDFKDLYASFTVGFGSRSVDVYVWKSVRGLRRNTYFKADDYLGAYVFYPYRKRRGLFGEIHLVKWKIGAGYVAHEIEHFMIDWLLDKLSNAKRSPVAVIISLNEPMSWLTGEVTRHFWNAWYKVEKREKNGKAK